MKVRAIPTGYTTVTPVLTLDDARTAIAWYQKGLGAEVLACNDGPDGKIMHAEIQIGSSRVMMHDAMMGKRGPRAIGGSPVSLWIYVEDCDALFERALAAGATVQMPIGDQFWGDRCGILVDPHGHTWAIATRKEDLTKEQITERRDALFARGAVS